MADKNDKVPENVSGPYYVDSACIGCGLCVNTAPENFVFNGEDKAYIRKQPEASEIDAVKTSLESCPVSAIGNDG